jgi:hypothetical protein
LENLEQDVEMARHFTPMTEAERQELVGSVHEEAGDGRFEWFKSTQFFDSKVHRQQHGFPALD